MPANWPELTLAIALALVVAYLVADVVARVVQSLMRGIVADPYESILVDRPQRVIRILIFLTTAAALTLPALWLAGVRTTFGGDPQAVVRWLLGNGLRIGIIAVAAEVAVRVGAADARRGGRGESAGSGRRREEGRRAEHEC